MHATLTNMQVLIVPLLKEIRIKSIKTINHVVLAREMLENLCFISVAPTVCVSHAFVYTVVDVDEMVIIFSIKLPSYMYVTTGLKTIP